MKKILAIVLALMLALTMCAGAVAETENPVAGKKVAYAAAVRHHLPDVDGFLRRPVQGAGRRFRLFLLQRRFQRLDGHHQQLRCRRV